VRGISERKLLALLALAAIVPIGTLLASSVAADVFDLLNPCFAWGASSGVVLTVSSGGPCTAAGATSETIPQMLIRNALVQGGILLGGALGVLGVLRGHLIYLWIGSGILFLESVPLVLGGAFVLTLMPATFLAWRAVAERRSGPISRGIRIKDQ